MARHLRYTTFAPGELEARIREMTPKGMPVPSHSQFMNAGAGGKGTLLKAHCCPVSYPDGQSGDCRYERLGPRWHLFHYEYEETALPRQIWMQLLGNDPASIEAKARELAASAYREATHQERKDVFQRASEPSDGSRKKNPKLYRLKAAEAKELAGKYALCRQSGTALVVVGPIYNTLDEANTAWLEKKDTSRVVACCNRLDRCWKIPRFNPLYAVFDPRPKTPEVRTSPGETKTVGMAVPKLIVLCPTEEPENKESDERPEPLGEETSAPPPAQSGPPGFDDWKVKVEQVLDALYGLSIEDLPDCPYAGWYEAGLTPEEAAGEAQEWAM